jgi:monomeric sarcosine oxidase
VTRNDYEYVVLGLGGIGSGAAYWLARRAGADVLGLEQFEFGHARGESHDHSRIIRLSYHTPAYVELAKRAYTAWSTLESESGERVVVRTGGLDLWPRDAAIPRDPYVASMRGCGVAFEEMDAGQVRRRWPQFRIDDDTRGVFQADGGIVAAARATAAHQRMAREHGATLLERTPVIEASASRGEIELRAGERRYRCRKLIVASGPWSNRALTSFDVRLPLEVTKEQVVYFAPRDAEAYALGRLPIWIWMDDPSFYGFPAFGDGVKVAQDAGGKPVDPDTRNFEPDVEALRRVNAFVERVLPGAYGPTVAVKTCLYTLPPDRDFVVDTLRGHANVAVAIGAGHAFKFASILGRVLSELAIDGTTDADLSAFAVDRPILTMAEPPKTYLV